MQVLHLTTDLKRCRRGHPALTEHGEPRGVPRLAEAVPVALIAAFEPTTTRHALQRGAAA